MNQTARFFPAHLFLAVVMVILQTTVLAQLGGLNLIPSLVLHLAAVAGIVSGGVIVLCLGLIQGLFSGAPAGGDALLYLFFFFAAYLIYRPLRLGHPLHQMGLVAVMLTVQHLFMSWALGEPIAGAGVGEVVRIAISALISPVAFTFYAWVEALQGRVFKAGLAE